jgi:hypothetical protein
VNICRSTGKKFFFVFRVKHVPDEGLFSEVMNEG